MEYENYFNSKKLHAKLCPEMIFFSLMKRLGNFVFINNNAKPVAYVVFIFEMCLAIPSLH